MTSESESVGENDPAPHGSGKANKKTRQRKPDIPQVPGIPPSPPPKTHCEITCKHEKNGWEKFKEGAEIFGIFLLFVYTLFTIKMYCANKEAANAAQSAAATAAKELELSERPWITVEPQIMSSLKFEAGDAQIKIRLNITNTGRTPAINVPDVMPEIYASFLTIPDPRQQRRDLCNQERSQATNPHNWSYLETIIPGQSTRDFDLLLNKASIQTAAFDTPKKLYGSHAPAGHFEIEIAECVIYSSSFSNDQYAVAYVFDLERRIENPPYENADFNTNMIEIPASNLILQYDPVAGNGPSTRY